MAFEAVQGEIIIGDVVDVLELKTKITSQYIDYREKLSYIQAIQKT